MFVDFLNRISVWGICSVVLLIGAPAHADAGDEWTIVPGMEVEVNGGIDPEGKVFISPDRHSLLILSSLVRDAILMRVESRVAHRVDRKTFHFTKDSTAVQVEEPVQPGEPVPTGWIGDTTALRVDQKMLKLISTGLVGETEILAGDPEYTRIKEAYKPSEHAVRFLKTYAVRTEIAVVFSSSCPSCIAPVGQFLKIFNGVQNPVFHIRYFDADRGGSLARFNVKTTPTVIIYQAGAEIGRVVRLSRSSMEEECVAILKSAGGAEK